MCNIYEITLIAVYGITFAVQVCPKMLVSMDSPQILVKISKFKSSYQMVLFFQLTTTKPSFDS